MNDYEPPKEKIAETYKLDPTRLFDILKKINSKGDDGFPFMVGDVGIELWGFYGQRRAPIGRLVNGRTIKLENEEADTYGLYLQLYGPPKDLGHVESPTDFIRPKLPSLLSKFIV